MLGSVDLKRDHLLEFAILDEMCYPGDELILCTDAVAEWAVRCYEQRRAARLERLLADVGRRLAIGRRLAAAGAADAHRRCDDAHAPRGRRPRGSARRRREAAPNTAAEAASDAEADESSALAWLQSASKDLKSVSEQVAEQADQASERVIKGLRGLKDRALKKYRENVRQEERTARMKRTSNPKLLTKRITKPIGFRFDSYDLFGFRHSHFTPFPPGAFIMQRPLSRRLIRFANFAFLFAAVLAISSHAGVLQLFGDIVEYIAPIVWPQPPIIQPGTAGGPPSDAIVLFDGKDMSAFKDGRTGRSRTAVPSRPSTTSTPSRPSATARSTSSGPAPEKVEGRGQGRGNSGVFMMGQYEIQILDSYDNDTYYDGQCASVYKQHPPMVNACRKPGEWQTYDIIWEAPKFDDAGQAPQAGLRDRAAQRRGGAEPLRADGRDLLVRKAALHGPSRTSCRCACSSTATRSASATSGSARSRTSSASPAITRITRGELWSAAKLDCSVHLLPL